MSLFCLILDLKGPFEGPHNKTSIQEVMVRYKDKIVLILQHKMKSWWTHDGPADSDAAPPSRAGTRRLQVSKHN